MRNTIMLLAATILCAGTNIAEAQKKAAGPHLLVYKTRKDYRNHVSVTLSDDKSKVVGYPDPKDISGGHVVPAALHKGYLLDNRGIGPNTAFLKLTNKEYGQLPNVPSPGELYKMIVDKDPLAVLCDCGNKYAYKDPVEEINKLIDENKLLTKCKVIKKHVSKK
jgi:hypothetical protein